MCEIAMLDPAEYSASELKQHSMLLYERMRSSLGLLAIYDENTHFEYDTYKDIDPDPEELFSFIDEIKEDDPHRIVIHGRLATHGAVNEQNAHPLEIDCPQCNVDYLIHNGIVSRHTWDKRDHQQQGHDYNTGVDSEVIAHNYGTVPTEFPDDGTRSMHGHQPGFLLANDEAVYIHGSRGYHLTKYAKMARTSRQFGPDSSNTNYERVIMTPSEE